MTFSSSRTLPGQSNPCKPLHDRRRDLGDRAAQRALPPMDDVPDQPGNVLAPLAQGRNPDREDVQPVVEVGAEAAVGRHRPEVAVGGGDQPHVHLALVRRAEPLELALLEHAQQLGLQLQRQVADLVEEDGAVVGELEAALAGGDGAGEGAPFVAEQLALDQRRRQRRAVDADQRRAGAAGCARAAPGRTAPCRCRCRPAAAPRRRSAPLR